MADAMLSARKVESIIRSSLAFSLSVPSAPRKTSALRAPQLHSCSRPHRAGKCGSFRPSAAFIHECHRLRSGDITGLDPVDAESRPFDHGTDRAVEVTATADAPPNRRQPILPPTHARIGCEAVLPDQDLPTRPQDPPHLCERDPRL